MDTPRRWQVASLATAVASVSIGGLVLARPTSDAVEPIVLDQVVDARQLTLASSDDPAEPTTGEPGESGNTIVTPTDLPEPLPQPSATSPDSVDESSGSATVSSPPPATSPTPSASPASVSSPSSVASSSSADSDD